MTDYDVLRATLLLVSTSDFLSVACMGVSISLNTCLCVDLILMVRYPFTNKENRIPFYLIYSVIISVTIGMFTVIFSYKTDYL